MEGVGGSGGGGEREAETTPLVRQQRDVVCGDGKGCTFHSCILIDYLEREK